VQAHGDERNKTFSLVEEKTWKDYLFAINQFSLFSWRFKGIKIRTGEELHQYFMELFKPTNSQESENIRLVSSYLRFIAKKKETFNGPTVIGHACVRLIYLIRLVTLKCLEIEKDESIKMVKTKYVFFFFLLFYFI